LSADEYAALKRHVKTRQIRWIVVLNSTQIVNPELALADEICYSLKPRLRGIRFFCRKPWSEAAGVDGEDQNPEQGKIFVVVRTIHEHLAAIGDAGAWASSRH